MPRGRLPARERPSGRAASPRGIVLPKNIVILADGTGNSAAKPFKTNVWRLYQALDVRTPPPAGQPRQIAFYDNGVGTQNLRPLAMLGLAFGVGLARNVRHLYTFLCRNYEPGDGIFLFGFSRGAFTVRILAGLVLRCGLVNADNDAELDDLVELAYAEYKRDAARRATATRRWLVAGHLLGGHAHAASIDRIEVGQRQLFPRIAFIGVWDTVDAYGMPVDELKMAIDQHVWPMTLADRDLSPHVDRACHALSLDDERPTFRPVLWTEGQAPAGQRLTQVWFAGVHANVGGGYPDDGLAFHTLQWMMDEAICEGLHFNAADLDTVDARANAQGQQHDSRAGVAGYYRYGPRNVDRLCHDAEHGVSVTTPLVHESVQARIHEWQVAYAPVSVPTRYDVVGRSGRGRPLRAALSLEKSADIPARAQDMEGAWNAVTRRRIAYFATVMLSLWLAALPLFDPAFIGNVPYWTRIAEPIDHAFTRLDALAPPIRVAATWLIETVTAFAPAWADHWVHAFRHFATLSVALAAIVLWLFFTKSHELQKAILARAEWAWRRV